MENNEQKPKINLVVRSYATTPHHATRIYDPTLMKHRIYACGADITDEVESTGVNVWEYNDDDDEVLFAIQDGVDLLIKSVWADKNVERSLDPQQFAMRLTVKPGMERSAKSAKTRRIIMDVFECDEEQVHKLIDYAMLPPEENYSSCGCFPKEVAGMQAKVIEAKIGHIFELMLTSPVSHLQVYIDHFINYVTDDAEQNKTE